MASLRIPDLNHIMIAGRLTRDPSLEFIQSGTALCKFAIAASKKYRTKDGEQKEDTVFVNVTCWGKTAEYVGENFHKGRAILVEGRLKSDEWETQGGEKRKKLSITADRVQSMQWDDDGGKGHEKASAPEDESDIPF